MKAIDTDAVRLAEASAAGAFDQVLEAESRARADLAQEEAQLRQLLEEARARRRAILERAQRRVVALHARVQTALDANRIPAVQADAAQGAEPPLAPAPGSTLWLALRSVAERLTCDDCEPLP
jgi:hypothetical protein